ncbi:MAG: ubiquinol-cytochrome c reductase iron-sulfur subunit [Bacteroidota bacterium]|nr:ubiquinol-cytochrome c reductase iron-sulfur subunit [Bacteroidota bacterium]MDP4232446.1 ubiquinol-cytochrome c reductase iron-sulfur subunit [Bacteroidota bacterium]MDP4241582.1 ubiquinol-cytochrome c reductase iron-sulfur subunit [Bacteroidota bacterium]MDP4286326.1 ubiquinol-cytochrome c reductase iron-sulfur subunit [Bacteroidota bacterium]
MIEERTDIEMLETKPEQTVAIRTDDHDGHRDPSRRSFLRWFLGIGSVSVAGVLSVPLIRFALDPLMRTTTQTDWSDLGPASDFAEVNVPQKRTISITQMDGWRKVVMEKSIYVVKGNDGVLSVFTATCPHLGCSVKWVDTNNQFKCPCHNGAFSPEGKLISGPPPRDLDTLESRLVDGHLQIRYQSFRQLVKTKEVLA